MKVILAGYNLDSEVIESLKRGSASPAGGEKPQDNVTPEVLSASYARISRDPRPIDQLREDARHEVGKARKSNQAIIFKMGHHSVAEHAIFNFDIIDVSRFAMEEIEKFRLCSYTEKSQRYQKLEDNYMIPDEIKKSEFAGDFKNTIDLQNMTYKKLVEKVEAEDARYITSLATKGQLGLTLNARNLELVFRRFASSKYSEVRQLGQEMYKQVEKIAPSIILFTQPNDLDKKTYDEIKSLRGNRDVQSQVREQEVTLANSTPDADEITLAALLHSTSSLSFAECRDKVKAISEKGKLEIIKAALKNLEFYDTTLREFEYVDLTYEIILSSACFGQLKRHRMSTQTAQAYDPIFGITIPPSIKEANLELEFTRAIEETEKTYNKMMSRPELRPHAHYILTNAHRKRILFKCNARELYHISRLREDKHAQWDIQNISKKMSNLASQVMPLTMLTICGKDVYCEVYKKVFGIEPKIKSEY